MIRPPEMRGAAFGDAGDGDARHDSEVRGRLARSLDIAADWAWLRQVHGAEVVAVSRPGDQGEADAAYTTTPGLPLAVTTADCVPVVLEGTEGVGVAHAGWRGAAAGVVAALRAAMEGAGAPPVRAAIGPAIRGCCFEVGPEVAARFPEYPATTEWGTPAVDLAAAVVAQLEGIDVWVSPDCTMGDTRFHSHRRDGTALRQVTVAWLPA